MAVAFRNWNSDGRSVDTPPAYFLQRLYDFDAELVLMPSREQPGAYVLGRRKQWGPGLTEATIGAIYTKADTKMAILNGCVPVCMVFKPVSGSWSPDGLIAKLAARDIWTHGGANKVADMLEAQEDAAKAANAQAIRDDLYNRSGDAWRSYQARTGQSSIKFKDTYPTKGQSVPSPGAGVPVLNSDSSSTAGLGKLRTPRKNLRKKRNATIGRRGH
jgi:hypothetical protein